MATIDQYRQLRHAAMERARRLNQAGFNTSLDFPRPSDVKNVNKELERLQKWMNRETSTVKGARAAAAAKAERAAAAAERKRERERQRYEQKRQAEGKTYTRRTAKTSEEKKAAKRDYQRKYRERQKEKIAASIADMEQRLDDLRVTDRKAWQMLINLKEALAARGIKVTSYADLRAWGDYIKERRRDSDKQYYNFDTWVEDAAKLAGKKAGNLKKADFDRVRGDFAEWQASQAQQALEHANDLGPNSYSAETMGDLWSLYISTPK